MVLEEGEKLHIIARRLFEGDLRRHFVGEVQAVGEVAVRLEGYASVLDASSNHYARRPQRRVRVFGLADSGLIINVIPAHLDLESLAYQTTADDRTVFTDGKSFSLDINEFSANR